MFLLLTCAVAAYLSYTDLAISVGMRLANVVIKSLEEVMEQSGSIARACTDFQYFVRGFDTIGNNPDDREYRYLGTWLESWLTFGRGFELTGRNHTTYLRVALYVADAAMRGEINWNYAGTAKNGYKDGYEREGIVAIDNPDPSVPDCIDPVDYEVLMCQWEHRREWLTGETAKQ